MAKYNLTDLFEGDYKVSQAFGADPTYYSTLTYAGYKLSGHEGVDFACPVGVWLNIPFEKGQILRVAYDQYYGNYVVIWDSTQRCAVWYCHMSQVNCSAGQVLIRGTRVGKTGQSGNVFGAHLHCGFVETDASANRINWNNGFAGFVNILDTNLVHFGTPVALTLEQKIQKITALFTMSLSGDQFKDQTKQILGV